MKEYTSIQTIIGKLYIVIEDERIVAIHMGEEDFLQSENPSHMTNNRNHPLLNEASRQLQEYLSGNRSEFDLPLKVEGTEFQMKVWKQLQSIPYVKTSSYQDVAVAIGNEKAVRAIGQANKANRLPIIIPCHRVIGKNQTLTGYAGKRINIKEELLLIEGAPFKK